NLYDKFGHTAIRVKTKTFDVAYNYGTYDWTTPNFYLKFARGKLHYSLTVGPFKNFIANYERENRTVREQVLDLNSEEKREIFNYLQTNARPENREYLYDFFYDNCATKPRDVLAGVLKERIVYNNYVEDTLTFRRLIRNNIRANSWGSLGIDIAMGAVVDRRATPWEHQFLPEYVYRAVNSASLKRNGSETALVKKESVLFKAPPKKEAHNLLLSPLFIFGLLALFIIIATLRDAKRKKRSRFLDAALFAATGSTGALLAMLWWATDHSATANNYNLLWAFPLSLLLTIAIARKQPKPWLRRYVAFLLLLLIMVALHWVTGVQRFAIGLLPLVIALGVRYVYLIGALRSKK
ncbi:MAG: DUF4105 domain-containing protein, partial [Marinirhabdus sp.]